MPTIYVPGQGYIDSSYAAGMGSAGIPGMAYGSSYGTYGPASSTMGQPLVTQQWADQYNMLAQMGLINGQGGAAGGQRDPQTTAAMSILQQMAEGKLQPYDEATKAAMLTKASDMNSAAEAGAVEAAMGDAAAGGASANDPSLAGARREFMARRQSGNAQAGNAIDMQANRANYEGQQQAAIALAGYDAARQGAQMNAMQSVLQGMYSGRDNAGGIAGATTPGSGQSSGGGGSIRPSGFGGGSLYGGNWDQWNANNTYADPNAGYGGGHQMYWNNPTYQGYASARRAQSQEQSTQRAREDGVGSRYYPSGY